ncbi:MAG TPA: hypothetical protein VKG44_01925 [Candidatus Baltobacteraceae bacterium]|nr:hypothetical protein [Candidatus Baltobacteraceae bacterium]
MMPPRWLLYVYSNKNIVGCVLGLVALGAYFGGVIHDYWFGIVAGAYGAGALATPGQPAVEADFEASLDPATISDGLKKYLARIQPLVPPDVFALVQSIANSIDGILPLLAKTNVLGDQDSFTIRQTALHYLPETMQTYLSLPPAFRNLQPMADGKTAKQLLLEQLTLLDAKLKEVVQNLLSNNAQALVANGAFLRQKFTKQSFLTPV